jgi:hypothetical protein
MSGLPVLWQVRQRTMAHILLPSSPKGLVGRCADPTHCDTPQTARLHPSSPPGGRNWGWLPVGKLSNDIQFPTHPVGEVGGPHLRDQMLPFIVGSKVMVSLAQGTLFVDYVSA